MCKIKKKKYKQCGMLDEGSKPALLSSASTRPHLDTISGSPVQEGSGHTGVNSVVGHRFG